MSQLLVLADDLTGAADSGAPFARANCSVLIQFRPGQSAAATVLARVAHNRHVAIATALARNRQALDDLATRPEWIYQKIDSTLRGHPVALLGDTMDALAIDKAVVAPAFPPQGRTTIAGQVLVDGILLSKAGFGVTTGHLPALFAGGKREVRMLSLDLIRGNCEALVATLDAAGHAVYLADAETQDDLLHLATAIVQSKVRLLCGSAGLAAALAAIPRWEKADPMPIQAPPNRELVVVVCGSQHPIIADQINTLSAHGIAITEPTTLAAIGSVWDQVETASAANTLVLSTQKLTTAPATAAEIAAALGAAVRRLADRRSIGGIILTGGDTALGVCDALHSSQLYLLGEIEAGVPYGRLGDGLFPGLPVVTKAGGFGNALTLLRAVEFLHALP